MKKRKKKGYPIYFPSFCVGATNGELCHVFFFLKSHKPHLQISTPTKNRFHGKCIGILNTVLPFIELGKRFVVHFKNEFFYGNFKFVLRFRMYQTHTSAPFALQSGQRCLCVFVFSICVAWYHSFSRNARFSSDSKPSWYVQRGWT